MTVCFHTLGCKVNQYETQALREMFEKEGFIVCDADRNADVIIINSCSVTAESDRKTRQLLRKCRKEKFDAVIVLTGCMVQAFPEKSKQLSEADIVIGNKDIKKIIEKVKEYSPQKGRVIAVECHKSGDLFNTPLISVFEERTRAYMKIEDGCDRLCSYCIIPYARGRVRSKDPASVRAEAQALSSNGFSEIVLVGINLSAYGKNTDYDLCDAVETIAGIEGIKRIRLGSLEPDHITDQMLYRLKAVDKFCPQFHLSLQSGCDETLKRMNRKYDTAFYKDLVERIRRIFEDAAITTDIMVGFSGETEEEFAESADFVKSIGFARAHIFPYSRRSGTVADRFEDQVPNAVKAERAKRMSEIAKKSEREFLKNSLGKVKPVLFETPEDGFAAGYTENYIRVKVKTDRDLMGKIVSVKLTEAFDDHCAGTIFKDF